VTESDPVAVLASQIDVTAGLLRGLSEADALKRYAPGKWSVKEVVGHLADTERIMGYRALRIARADETPLPGFDENAYVPPAKFDDRSLDALIADFRTVRAATVQAAANGVISYTDTYPTSGGSRFYRFAVHQTN